MHILAVCPACLTRYQVQPALRGKSMRCPNDRCRKVFVVREVEEGKPRREEPRQPAAPKPQRSGQVGELVPILPAEPDAPEEVIDLIPLDPPKPVNSTKPSQPQPDPAASWRDAPPPVRGSVKPPPAPAPRPKPKAKAAPPVDSTTTAPAAPSWDAPPPVRRGKPAPEPKTLPALMESDKPVEQPAPESSSQPPSSPRGHGKAYALIAALLVLVMIGLGVAGFVVWRARQAKENTQFEDALKEYKSGAFRTAADLFRELEATLSDGDRKEECRFYIALATLRAELCEAPPPGTDIPARTEKGLGDLEEFVARYKGQELLNKNAPDLGDTLVKVVTVYVKSVERVSSEAPLGIVDRAAKVKELIADLREGLTEDEGKKIDDELQKVRNAVTYWKRHEEALDTLKRLGKNPSAEAIKVVLHFINREEETFRGLAQEGAVVEIKNRLLDGHFASVTFEELPEDLERPEATDLLPVMAVVPPVVKSTGTAGEGIDLFMARGILYALERGNGQFRWAFRVGLDISTVPVRLPRFAAGRERFLVLSDDATVLHVVDDGGAPIWRYVLGQPCLGKPLVIDERAYLPTADGLVHVLDLKRGQRLGMYKLGQRLSGGGGARQEGTRRLFFPADEYCVYVLDTAERRCIGILYTGHPAGSLRSEPLIVAPENPGGDGGYLVLNQTAGVDETLLRVFKLPRTWPLPASERFVSPVKLEKEPRLRGWSWFPPHADDEKIVVVTDAGRLGLFGIKQADNLDEPLFPLLPHEPGGIRLDLLLPPGAAGRGRAQVVYARGNDLWLLANGKLQCVVKGEVQKVGLGQNHPALKLLAEWPAPLNVGLPLHAAQVAEDLATDRATLLLATQLAAQQVCLATAVEDKTGALRWQRQLGMVCRGDPLPLFEGEGDPTPLLIAIDQGGALFLFDPRQHEQLLPGLAQNGGARLEGPVEENPLVPPILVAGPNPQTAISVLSPGRGKEVWVRQVHRDPNPNKRSVIGDYERRLPIDAALAGTPAVVGARLLLPLENGKLMYVTLPADGSAPKYAASWRDNRLGLTTRGHVIPLGAKQFLTTDGHQSITHWTWQDDAALPSPRKNNRTGEVPVTYQLSARLAGVPVVLPPEKMLPLRVCLADVRGKVTLFNMQDDGNLTEDVEWDLGAPVTAGPFVRLVDGVARLGCVVEETRLAWLDPLKGKTPLWWFDAKGEIVGEPQLLGGVLVVALRQGAYVGVSPATGKATGEPIPTPSGVAPAISPVPFGPGRLFAPLADGTILLPEQRRFGLGP